MLGSLYAIAMGPASLQTPQPPPERGDLPATGIPAGRGTAGGAGAAAAAHGEGNDRGMSLDWSILYWIQSHTACDLFDLLMPKLTLLGSGGAVWLLAAGGLLCTKKYRRQGVILLAGLAVGVLVGNMCLKTLIARSRPCWLDDSVFMLISVPTDYSFPSGHTLASAIGATVLTKTNRRFGWAAIPLAAIIAFSRLYLFVHFPSDILAGGCWA